ncbi:MAG: hypothetical protein KGV44_09770 [Flavobacteriaceae bacterium]|nr:hypothetical protein [Flavobacteriaceae bacterium]
MKAKQVILLCVIFILTNISGYIALRVLSGEIGNYETWRIICSIVGFLLIFGLFAVFTLRMIKENKKLKKK